MQPGPVPLKEGGRRNVDDTVIDKTSNVYVTLDFSFVLWYKPSCNGIGDTELRNFEITYKNHNIIS